MTPARDSMRDWHRLFGLVLIDYFSGSPFTVEVERDLSQQQQYLDVVIIRRRRGRFAQRLPDGLDGLVDHNLISFKSHHEALKPFSMKELVHHYVAYLKLVSPSPSNLLSEERFRLVAVCARYPHNLAGQVPWRKVQEGVYDCTRGTDVIRVLVAGELPREPHNAPLHLFSASPDLVGFASETYQTRSPDTSTVLGQLFQGFRGEGLPMAFTMEDFRRQVVLENFPKLTREEQAQVLRALTPEERVAGLSADQLRHLLDQMTAAQQAPKPRKPRRKK